MVLTQALKSGPNSSQNSDGSSYLQTKASFSVQLEGKTETLDGKNVYITAATLEELPDYDLLLLSWQTALMGSLCGAGAKDDDNEDDRGDY